MHYFTSLLLLQVIVCSTQYTLNAQLMDNVCRGCFATHYGQQFSFSCEIFHGTSYSTCSTAQLSIEQWSVAVSSKHLGQRQSVVVSDSQWQTLGSKQQHFAAEGNDKCLAPCSWPHKAFGDFQHQAGVVGIWVPLEGSQCLPPLIVKSTIWGQNIGL